MEEIKHLVKKQRFEYALLWAVSAVTALCFEAGWLPDGICAGDARAEYALETAGILLAVALIPLSLKLFSLAVVKKIRKLPLREALKAYGRWSRIRLSMLAAAVWANLLVYYLTLHAAGGLCALMGLTASLFCLPGEKRAEEELEAGDV